MIEPDRPSPRRARAALMLAGGSTSKSVAARLEVDRSTLVRWRKDPGFQRLVIAGRTRMTERALGLLERASVRAVGVLVALTEKGDASDGVKVRACEVILSHAVRYREQVELAARVAELEAKIDGAA